MLSVEAWSIAGICIFGPEMLECHTSVLEVKERVISQNRDCGSWLRLFHDDQDLEEHAMISSLCNTEDIQLLAVFIEIPDEEKAAYVADFESCVRRCYKPERGCESLPLRHVAREYLRFFGCKVCRHNRTLVTRKSACDTWHSLPVDARHDLSLASLASHTDAAVYELLCEDQKADRKIASEVLKRTGLALRFAPNSIRSDRTLARSAVSQNGLALQYVPDCLRADNVIVTAATRQNKEAIQFAHEDLQPDVALMNLLIKPGVRKSQEGPAPLGVLRESTQILRLVPAVWKSRKAFVKAAVRINGLALEYASASIAKDSGIAMDAVRNTPYAIYFVDQEIVPDPRILKWCDEILDVKTVLAKGKFAIQEMSPISLL